MTENEIGRIVVTRERSERGLKGERQVPVTIDYRGIKFDEGQ
jgi:hypothetical protein